MERVIIQFKWKSFLCIFMAYIVLLRARNNYIFPVDCIKQLCHVLDCKKWLLKLCQTTAAKVAKKCNLPNIKPWQRSSKAWHKFCGYLWDVWEGHKLPPFLAAAFAVIWSSLPSLQVHRVSHDVFQLHQLHPAAYDDTNPKYQVWYAHMITPKSNLDYSWADGYKNSRHDFFVKLQLFSS